MASKKIAIEEKVYERLIAHKRGDESFSEMLGRLLDEYESDWRTDVGFLTDEGAADLEAEVNQGLDDLDGSFADLGNEMDEQL